MIEQKRKYDHPLQVEFKKALQREKALIARNPETTECGRVKRKCEDEVRRQFPPDSFFIPEEELDNDQRKRTKAETPTPRHIPTRRRGTSRSSRATFRRARRRNANFQFLNT